MPNKVLIKGGTVLSLDRAVGNLVGADVLIEDGLISEVGRSLRARGADVVDAADTIVMPGFVDAHRHVWCSVLGKADATSGAAAAAEPGAPDPDDIYAATLTGLLQALEAGITTVVDWCDSTGGDAHLEAALTAHAESGVRTVIVPPPHVGSAATVTSTGVPIAFASPDVVESELDHVGAAWAAARQAGRRIHAHAGTAGASGGEVAELGRRGLLGPDVTLCHCPRLSAADCDAVARSSTAVALAPTSDMAAGVGPPPMQQLLDRSIRPGLGVGDGCLAPRDVFAQMRAVISVQHAMLFDLKLAGKGGIPNLLGTRDVLRYATIDGARAAGLSDVTGSLSPGKRADVVVLRADRPNIAPVNDPIGAVVWGMDTSNVDFVFAGGVPLVERGTLTADVARARALVAAASRADGTDAGLPAGAGARRP
jgi:cytosine/adenosine deaminase-related metal-dependent hydrolase